jgi:hypothetical protein
MMAKHRFRTGKTPGVGAKENSRKDIRKTLGVIGKFSDEKNAEIALPDLLFHSLRSPNLPKL